MSDLTDAIDAWTEAERTADTATLERLLTDDFVGVGPLGFMLPKPAWLARHQSGDLTYESFGLEELNARTHGDAAVITARHVAVGAFQGHPIPETARATVVFSHETGSWQLAGVHLSFIAGTPGAPPMPGT